MRNPDRIDRVIGKLGKVWHEQPDWRLCQLLSNLHGTGPQEIFFTEDDKLEATLDDILTQEEE